MQSKLVIKTMGVLLLFFSFTQLPPVIVDLFYERDTYPIFILSFLIIFLFGALLWLPMRRFEGRFRVREGILVVVLFWLGLSLFATIPFLLLRYYGYEQVGLTDAFFESISGLTTTGATIFFNLEVIISLGIYPSLVALLHAP